MNVVKFPNNVKESDIFKFCDEVEKNAGVDSIGIDFTHLGRIVPFTMVYVAKFIRDFNSRNPQTSVKCTGFKKHDYAANMGFFKAFGLQHGRAPNCSEGNDNFVPYTILPVKEIVDQADEEWIAEQDVIENRSEKLSQILARESSGDLVDALTFSIREIMRNVYEHSHSQNIEYCAQYWPYYNSVQIAILDNGIGLRESLKLNPHIQVNSDSDAIQQGLMPAISSKNYKGARIDTNDPWHNSGFGLYMVSRICRLGGTFLLCSGDHAIRLDEDGKHHMDLNHFVSGTVVKMVLKTDRLKSLSEMLSTFRNEGYEIAKEIKGLGFYEASSASQMLSRDFKK